MSLKKQRNLFLRDIKFNKISIKLKKMIRFFVTAFLLVLIVPQTSTDNLVVKILYDTRWFENYGQTYFFVNVLTWLFIFLYLFFTVLG
jgi:hypothetical protein